MSIAKEAHGAGLKSAWPATAWKQSFRRRLLAWYRRNARDLAWRKSRDPFRIWVSEIMLQQTQVATVSGYFSRFLLAFPSVEALAAAPEEQVLRLWEGLGYYRRARQLHRAAQVIVAEHAGQFPREFEAVLALPGIGRYTAGAITSIAYDARSPILEANTIRL
ncbi:MAG TPA: A/G-specific adenine glycosylase, partial [Pirellulales bacterium]|nr:A/G-specific adenine glycosylase [Pirellulales bacterium]